MSNVIVDKSKIDILANAISCKSGEPVTMTLDDMVSAVDGIDTSGITPTGNINITGAGVTDVTDYATATLPVATYSLGVESNFYTENGVRKWRRRPFIILDSSEGDTEGWIGDGTDYGSYASINAIASGTTVTPTESSQTIGGSSYMMEGAVTVSAIPSNYVGSGITQRSSSDLSASTLTVTAPSGYYSSNATKTLTDANLVAGNIKKDVPIFGVTGSYEGSGGTDVPTFTVTLNSSYEVTATCDKTYSECRSILSGGTDFANIIVVWPDSSQRVFPGGGFLDISRISYYAIATDDGGVPMVEIRYDDNDIDAYYPPTTMQSLTVDDATTYNAALYYEVTVPAGTAGTPSASKGTVSNHAISVTPSVTNSTGWITGSTKTGTAVSVSASELVSGTYTVDSSGTKDVTNYASASVPSGTAGTPSASKGAVSNHQVTVTPSVTNTTGWITGSTKTGTGVTVTASELVSGSQTLSDNGDYDVTNLASVTVSVSGGGGNLTVATATKTLTSAASTISFTGLSGNPTSFVVTSSADQSTGGTKVVSVVYDGTSCHGMDITTQAEADTGFTQSYSSGTLTITATTASFQANEYKLVYTYGGSSSDIHTADVQVGSGATSITFSSLSGKPAYFSCVFKSTFGTSSGYQRVIDVVNDGTNTYGHAMDSSAKAQTSWSHSYSGGSLTITSTGTNNGGYFHQPGYYQLTYAVDSNAPQHESVSKTYRASTSAQSETITPSSGYDAIEEVSISIPAVSQTNLTAANIKSGTTISISNGQSNLWSVTGSYTGGGGDSKNVQINQSTTRTTTNTLSKANGDLTVSKTGTYDVYWTATRSATSTNYTWGSQLYVGGSAYGSENTTWSNHVQNNHLSNVSLTANQKIAVYTRGRSGSYYVYAPMLVIVEA